MSILSVPWRRVLLLLFLSLLAVAGCADVAEPAAEGEDELRTSYGDLAETLDGPDLDRWIAVRAKLAAGFDRICGDTICAGDFSNLQTVRIACTSTRAVRKLRDCVWVLGGSIDRVDAATGAVTTDARVFSCPVPVAGRAPALLDALTAAGDDALLTPLPGADGSFYDALVACFEGVHGAPAPAPAPTPGDFADLADLEPSSDGSSWLDVRQKISAQFVEACGDSFCEGEYFDIAPLRLVCPVERAARAVARCSWSFALANVTADARGKLRVSAATRTCAVDVDASVPSFLGALAGDGPLHAALPGKTTSIHHALIGCL